MSVGFDTDNFKISISNCQCRLMEIHEYSVLKFEILNPRIVSVLSIFDYAVSFLFSGFAPANYCQLCAEEKESVQERESGNLCRTLLSGC